MPQYKKAPPASTRTRVRAWVQTPLGAGLVAGFVLLLIGYYFFNTDDSSAPVDPGAVAAEQRKEQSPPEDATEQAAQRPFWVLPPQTFPDASKPGEGVAKDISRRIYSLGCRRKSLRNPATSRVSRSSSSVAL